MSDLNLVQALAVTAEICGTNLSEPAAKVLAEDLRCYDRAQVIGALKRCRAELKSRLTLSEIISRLDDGRPGPDEAFAMLPRGEDQTVVWTDEMAAAASFRDSDADNMTQRLAFKEAYTKAVAKAREARQPARWWVSMGHDQKAREAPIAAAVAAGRLTLQRAQEHGVLLEAPDPQIAIAMAGALKRIA